MQDGVRTRPPGFGPANNRARGISAGALQRKTSRTRDVPQYGRAIDTQNLLGARDAHVVHGLKTKMTEPGAQATRRCQHQSHAVRRRED